MKKVIKYKSELTGQEITFIASEKLNKQKGKVQASEKLDKVNELLRSSKTTLPK